MLRPWGYGLLLACVCATPAWGQASANVSTLDPVYRDFEKLRAFRLLDTVIFGQRPYTRLDFGRFALQARRRLSPEHPATARRIVEELERRFGDELNRLRGDHVAEAVLFRPVDQLDLAVVGARSPGRPVRTDGRSGVHATINPLLGYRQGRDLDDGTTASFESLQRLRLTNSFVAVTRPRLYASRGRGVPNAEGLVLQEAYAHVGLGILGLHVGRSDMVWGQGRHAGLVISENALGMDMVKLSFARPWVPPSFLRVLGPVRASIFLATTAADEARVPPNSYMVGYKLSFQPAPWLELGGSLTLESGGDGAPSASFGQRLAAHFFFLDLFVPDADLEISNKIVGTEFKIRIPGARGLQIYGEWAFDDAAPSDFGKWFLRDSGYLAGVYLPRVDHAGRLDVSAEYQFGGVRMYRHAQFRSGLARDQRLIGSMLGPEARAGYIELHWDPVDEHTLSLDLAYEARSHDEYEVISTVPSRIAKVRSLPQERRYRTMTSWSYRPTGRALFVQVGIGYERVNTFDFVVGRSLDNLIGEVRLQWRY
jgi:hypothetical protein